MKIVMVGPDKNAKGGIASVINNFVEYFGDPSIEILDYITWKEGSSFHHLLNTIFGILRFPFFIRAEKPDILHIHVAQYGSFYRKSLYLMLGKMFKLKIILHMHGSQFEKFYEKGSVFRKKYVQYVLNKADILVVLSESWKEFYSQITTKNIEVIKNCVSVPQKNLYNKEAKDIIFFGNIGERKGVYDILDIASALQTEIPETSICLYGNGDIVKIKKIITEGHLENVIVKSWVSEEDKPAIYRKAMMHILPSYQEGLPMAILETMAQGIPNISTFVGGIPELIENRKNGVLIRPGKQEDLKEAIIELANNKAMRVAYSEESFKTIENQFSINNQKSLFYKIYNDLMRIEYSS
ncbi:glycosyltransferase family 4 protein [Enterococcus rivorum]|uniref:Glycosyl transferase family 1 domain-containing protein n=1 Tax=Enterococcus rivorum TaxID=762845 RepID=A0A1E5KSC0_9ENTE|nr:glycosyltransferase family 4 protein [Enterococcus rivorum]MBP2097443.1 glycosyltransferase involved in cell wall biosynthesis [Enterococcus rivorum]OEH80785.1 hypothetical protein BCR26_07230 [Enterococcus rivorum]